MNSLQKSPEELHVPVMLGRTIEILGDALTEEGSVLVDCTLGLGGHTEACLLYTSPSPRD